MSKNTQLATTDNATDMFTEDQVELIKRNICPNATDDELQLFLGQCRRTRLDPFARQIYSIARNVFNDATQKWEPRRSIQTSIDGFRLIAERTGKYRGQTAQQWCSTDGVWQDYWTKIEAPAGARVGVFREGSEEPIWGFARFASYASVGRDGKPVAMWRKMPEVMIAKCAEALALRRAFPQELSGLETTEEMEQADEPAEPRTLQIEAANQQETAKVIEAGGTVTVIEPKKTRTRKPKEEPKPETPWQDVVSHVGMANGPMLGKKVSEIPRGALEWLRDKWMPKLAGLTNRTDKDEALAEAVTAYFAANPEPPQEEPEPPIPEHREEVIKTVTAIFTEPNPLESEETAPQATAEPETEEPKMEWRSVVLSLPSSKYSGHTLGEFADSKPGFLGVDCNALLWFRTFLNSGIKKIESKGNLDIKDKILINAIRAACDELHPFDDVVWLDGLDEAKLRAEINRRFDAESVSSTTREKILAEVSRLSQREPDTKEFLRYVLGEWENVEVLIEGEK